MKKTSRKYRTINKTIATALLIAAAFSTPAMLSSCTKVKQSITELSPSARMATKPNQGVYYSLFVRSFADSDGDGIGDFNGITEKLDYLNDGNDTTTTDLGVTGIWLLPIYPSHSYHGYDVDDYYSVNPEYGTMEDFENLLAECKKRNISVILDLTLNHSSTYIPWFKASRNPQDPHHNWYIWSTEKDGINPKQQMWGHNLWTEDLTSKGNYYSGLFGDHMPDFNWESQELREEFKNVMKFWMDKGVAGFRFDAAGHVYNSAKIPMGTSSTEKAVQLWKEMVDFTKTVNPDSYSVGEVWEKDSTRAQYAAGLGSDFHFDMGSRIEGMLKSGSDGNDSYATTLEAEYKKLAQENPDYIDAPFLSNHDQARTAGVLKGDTDSLKAAASLYMLTEGVPFIYYGEEIAMRSGADDPSKRTPMLWAPSSESGIPQDKLQTTWADSVYNKKTVTVAEQQKDKDSLLNYYKRLIRLRTAHSALYQGRFNLVQDGNSAISCWQMESPEEICLIMVNTSQESTTAEIPYRYAAFRSIFYSHKETKRSGNTLVIPARGTVVLSSLE